LGEQVGADYAICWIRLGKSELQRITSSRGAKRWVDGECGCVKGEMIEEIGDGEIASNQ
jgi:hypothetical protein